MMKISNKAMKMLVRMAHKRIENALPEDEPDCVPDWVCETLVQLGFEFGLSVTLARKLNEANELKKEIKELIETHGFDFSALYPKKKRA